MTVVAKLLATDSKHINKAQIFLFFAQFINIICQLLIRSCNQIVYNLKGNLILYLCNNSHSCMQSKLDEIKQDLKQARQLAYLCKYHEAQKRFKHVIDSVQQQIILNNIHPKNLEDYRKFEAAVIQQKNIVQAILGMTSNFSANSHSTSIVSSYNKIPHHSPNSRLNHKFSESQIDNFGSRQQLHPQYDVSNQRNYSLNKTNNEKNMQYLNSLLNQNDPDIWVPPPPLPQRKKPPIKRTISNEPQSNYNSRNGSIKNINKNGTNKKIPENNGKKTFLADRYPDGNGPDKNLIQMLQKQVVDTSPNVAFDDIAELETAKGLLQQAVLLPLKMPQFFTGIRRAWKGVMMFGPPGTGKTLLAKAVASSGGTTFFNVSASSLASKWKGQSQKMVRILFQMAKFYAPSVIFFDEIDAIGGKRKDGQDQSNRKVKTQLLVQMDGATSSQNEQNKFVIVLAATNRPWDLDQALRRRLQKRIYIPLPTQKGRKQLIRINLKNVKMEESLDLDFVVKKTQGFSGADLTNVCRQAAYMPMRRMLKNQGGFKNINDMGKFQEKVNVPLTKQDFVEALKNVNKSVGKQDLKKYEAWMKQFGSV